MTSLGHRDQSGTETRAPATAGSYRAGKVKTAACRVSAGETGPMPVTAPCDTPSAVISGVFPVPGPVIPLTLAWAHAFVPDASFHTTTRGRSGVPYRPAAIHPCLPLASAVTTATGARSFRSA